jgi:hypothetical protein
LAKGIPIPVYEKDCHLLQIARERPEDFIVIGRDYYSHEAQMIDTYHKVKTKNKPEGNRRFFDVY